jgi:hypothetical protein
MDPHPFFDDDRDSAARDRFHGLESAQTIEDAIASFRPSQMPTRRPGGPTRPSENDDACLAWTVES